MAPMDRAECEGHSGQAEARRARPIGDDRPRTPFLSPECAGSHGNSAPHVTIERERGCPRVSTNVALSANKANSSDVGLRQRRRGPVGEESREGGAAGRDGMRMTVTSPSREIDELEKKTKEFDGEIAGVVLAK